MTSPATPNRTMVQTYIPASIAAAARVLSARTGRSMSAIVADMVVEGALPVLQRMNTSHATLTTPSRNPDAPPALQEDAAKSTATQP